VASIDTFSARMDSFFDLNTIMRITIKMIIQHNTGIPMYKNNKGLNGSDELFVVAPSVIDSNVFSIDDVVFNKDIIDVVVEMNGV